MRCVFLSFFAGCCRCIGGAQLLCDGFEEFDLSQHFFDEFAAWQPLYGRDSIKMSRDFLYSIFEPRIMPHLEQILRKCPVPVLEIMMNTILALDTDRSTAEAQWMYETAMRAADQLAGTNLDVANLLAEWTDDAAHVYPFLFGMRPHDCHGSALKVFVYELPDNFTQPMLYCHHGQWGTEVLFHRFFMHSACRTTDPDEADFFYVPVYGTCLFVRNKLSEGNRAANDLWDPLVAFLAQQPSYHRRGRMDHIFLFADGQGPRIWDAYDLIQSDSIFLAVESKCPTWDEPTRRYTDVKPCVSAWKDVLIPGHTDHARKRYMLKHNRPSAERDLLLTFHGRHPGAHESYGGCAVRGAVMELEGLEGADVGGFVLDYLERKGRSHFCLVPGGTSPWTNHLYESFFCGCVPVILSDEYEVAFQHVLPWPTLSIKWPEAAVGDLYEFLRTFPRDKLAKMKAEVDRHACWFDYMSEDPTCSPYLAVISALEERKRRFPSYHGRFWNAEVALTRANRSSGGVPPRRATRFHVLDEEAFQLQA